MPTINRNNAGATRATTPAGTTATNATNATNATGAANNTPPADATQPPAPSANGQAINARPVTINGLQNVRMTATNATNRFSSDANFNTYTAAGDGPVERGFIEPEATAIPGGFRLEVRSFHKIKNSKVTLFLQAEVLDQKTNQLKTVTLSVLTNNEDLCGDGYRGVHHFDIKYDDLNKFLQSKNPNLKINPGTTNLAVTARWDNGHQAGGPGRGGSFRLPAAGAAQSVVGVRASAGATDQADLPLDMQVAFPKALTGRIRHLKPDGNIVSRLESELKGEASKQDMTAAVTKMYDLAAKAAQGDKTGIEQMLGKDWTIETVNRYWLKDDGSDGQPGKAGTGFFQGFRVDDDGLPMQDPMNDQYMDDDKLRMTQHEGAIRLRKNKQATVVNVKPGGGRRDARTNITQRVEVGVELKPDASASDAAAAMKSLATDWQWSGTVFNHAQRQVHELDENLKLQDALKPWLEVIQDRHKFTVKNEKTGVELELSFDKVMCKTLRPEHNVNGQPQTVEFYVLEAELDHLQLQSSNASTYAAAGSGTGSPTAGYFQDDATQDKWLSGVSDQVTLDIEPRLHELGDLQNSSFRQTTSYKQFEGATGKLIPALFPNGLTPGVQKSAAAAYKLGLATPDAGSAAATAPTS